MITAAQLRAARGLLDWTRADLAKAAGVSPETIKNIEHGTFRPQEATADAIVRAFHMYDVKFTEKDGVKIEKDFIKLFEGTEGYIGFLEDIIQTVRAFHGGPTRQYNFSDNLISTHGKTHLEYYNESMQAIPNIDAKCLVPFGDTIFPVKHCQYKWLDKVLADTVPFYLYGNKVAVLSEGKDHWTWIVVTSESLSQAFHKQFDVFWEKSTVPTAQPLKK